MLYRTATLSAAGGRIENQDYCGFTEESSFSCWVVADGLGGHQGGEIASRIAVESVLEAFRQKPDINAPALMDYITAAQSAIVMKQVKNPRLFSMRTTIVVLLTGPGGAIWAHAGDSRLYHFSGGRIVFQSADHNVPQAMAKAGDISADEIRGHEDRSRLLRTLGNPEDLRPSVEESVRIVKPGDAFLLCSDGFWEYVPETEMAVDLARSGDPESWLGYMTKRLLTRAENEYDNYTAVAVFAAAVEQTMP